MSELRLKNDVTLLNFSKVSGMVSPDELRTPHPFANPRPRGSQDAFPLGQTLRRRVPRPSLWLPPAAHLHGLRPVDLARGTAGYRHLFECEAFDSASFGIQPAHCKIHTRGCQRTARLAPLGGPCQRSHAQGPSAVCRGRSRLGSGKYDLRTRFDHHRSLVDTFPLGRLPADQSAYQDAYPDRPAGADSNLHPYHRCPPARRWLARQPSVRTRRILSDGSRLHGFRSPLSHCKLGSLLRHAGKDQTAIHPALLAAGGSLYRFAKRSCRQALSRQIAAGLPGSLEKSALLRLGNGKGIDLSHQQPGDPSADSGHALQGALAHRIVLPMDQATSANQTLLRHKSQRGEDADMDRGDHLSDGRDHS